MSKEEERDLDELERSETGNVPKSEAMSWWGQLGNSKPTRLLGSVIPKPYGFKGGTYATPISTLRLTGNKEWITEVAKLLRPLLHYEGERTRVAISIQKITDRDTEEETPYWALYLHVAQRGGNTHFPSGLLGHRTRDPQILIEELEELKESDDD